jgi:hypothetical protein
MLVNSYDASKDVTASSVITMPEQEVVNSLADQEFLSIRKMLDLLPSYLTILMPFRDRTLLTTMLLHMFIQINTLYCSILPTVASAAKDIRNIDSSSGSSTTQFGVWDNLQLLLYETERTELISNLFENVVKSCLISLDTLQFQSTNVLQEMPLVIKSDSISTVNATPDETWDVTLSSICETLLMWQQTYANLPSFAQQFEGFSLPSSDLMALDTDFSILLDSAGAVFGDIIPGFRLLPNENAEASATLLFDFLQQCIHINYHIDHIHHVLPLLSECFSFSSLQKRNHSS